MSNIVELKYPISVIEDGKKKEVKFLTAGRLQVGHFELLPASLMEKADEDGNKKTITFTVKEMLPLFKELIPFVAAIFNISVESAKSIDYEDIENVFKAMENILPKDEKKN